MRAFALRAGEQAVMRGGWVVKVQDGLDQDTLWRRYLRETRGRCFAARGHAAILRSTAIPIGQGIAGKPTKESACAMRRGLSPLCVDRDISLSGHLFLLRGLR